MYDLRRYKGNRLGKTFRRCAHTGVRFVLSGGIAMPSPFEIEARLRAGARVTPEEIYEILPKKNCGLCGFKNCRELAYEASKNPDMLRRCVFLPQQQFQPQLFQPRETEVTWHDMLGRDYDFVLDPFPEDPGPREHILLANAGNLKMLAVKKGDILFGRPALNVGCPVTHCGVVIREPDYLNGSVEWCIVGPQLARQRGKNIGLYSIIAYEGIVTESKTKLEFGRRYFFLPRYCVLQARHSGLINTLAKRGDGYHVRLEGIWLG
jgi:uncharacterized Fe-S cluster-containing protein